MIPHTQKSKISKFWKNQKGVPKTPQKWLFFKNAAKFEFPMVNLVGIDTPCEKKKNQKFSSENHQFFGIFLKIVQKRDPVELKRKKIQKVLLNIKCPQLWIRKSQEISDCYIKPFFFYTEKTTGGGGIHPPPGWIGLIMNS